MTVAPTEYRPDIAIPPGVTVREVLESLCMSQADLAERLGRPASAVNEIIQGKKAITAETAIGLARILPYPAEFWLQLERNYQLTQARIQEVSEREASVAWMRDSLPLGELHKRGFIGAGRGIDRGLQLEEVLRFFAVGSVSAWKDYWGECVSGAVVAFRRSEGQTNHIGRIATWLRLGEIEARKRACNPYNSRAFMTKLRELRHVTAASPEVFEPALESLAECGVVVTLIREIPGAGVSGATRWMSRNQAHIQLSLRHKTDDQFWFSFFHEAGHVVLHGKDAIFIESDRGRTSDKEEEANSFAREMLIPRRFVDELPNLRTRCEIVCFANKLNIAPGIVVGRLQCDGFLGYALGNAMGLKRKFRWTE